MTFIYFYITALQCGLIMVLYYANLERKQALMLCLLYWIVISQGLYGITSVTFL